MRARTRPRQPAAATAIVATQALSGVLLGSPVGQSFVPPSGSGLPASGVIYGHRAPWTRRRRLDASCGLGFEGPPGWRAGPSIGRRGGRRRSTALEAGDRGSDNEGFSMRNYGSSMDDEDRMPFGEEELRRIMFDLDPDDENQGPMYIGGEGDQGPTVEYDKPEYELRFEESFVAVCLDREEAPDEAKNYPFWGVRLRHQYDHVKWARRLMRKLSKTPEAQAALVWDRSLLSPSKYKIVGNIICVRGHNKAAALELLESDPFWNVGLYKSVSLYRYPYSQDGEFNWQAKPYPYVALCMDKPGHSQLRKETRPRHLKYLSISQRIIDAGPLFPPDSQADDPKAVPVGSLVFFSSKSDELARDFAERDPYNVAGLFDNVFVTRFNEIDLDGVSINKPRLHDPLRDEMVEEGLGVPQEIPTDPKWRPFDSLAWLAAENSKKDQEELNRYRMELYEARDDRLAAGTPNEGAIFKEGCYVYIGRRNETEWYDYWPLKLPSSTDGWGDDRYTMNNSYPPVDIYSDDL